MNFNEDIFVIDCWTDTESKENDLIGLIKILKNFNIPILLTGHYAIKPEIQKMVDYYLFDKDNPILTKSEFADHGVSSGRWSEVDNYRVDTYYEFHHDYAIWTTMRNAFNFANYLGKKYVHFLEYDNLPDPVQYRQAFLEYSRNHDAIIYEYSEGSSGANAHLSEFSATFIFSIKTDIALSMIDKIKSKREYFTNRPQGWQLERTFLKCLKEVTNRIYVSKYIANNNELNTQAVWDRDGVNRNGAKFQIYLAGDESGNLHIHFIPGFTDRPADKNYLVEICYGEFKSFHTIDKDRFSLLEIGKYQKGGRVKVYYLGVEVFNEFLGQDFSEFRDMKKLTYKGDMKPKKINVNFADGAFAEVLGDYKQKIHVEFIDTESGRLDYSNTMDINCWAKTSRAYFIKWKIKIKGKHVESEYDYNATGARVLIGFESKSIGDTIAWFPYVEEFRKKHNCHVICSTFHNALFRKQYPEIEFMEPGGVANNLYAVYRLGYFYNEDRTSYDTNRHPEDPKALPLQKVASDILGLEYTEIIPKMPIQVVKKKKKVCIGFHSTAQAKYWNNPTGWQDVCDYLTKKGYEVLILSKEDNGYMGNHFPKGVPQLSAGSIDRVMKNIQESELFIGVSSGLSWVAWACNIPTILISGFTDESLEPKINIFRVINKDVCNGCWGQEEFDPGNWNWCPYQENTERMFECSKAITPEMVIEKITEIIG